MIARFKAWRQKRAESELEKLRFQRAYLECRMGHINQLFMYGPLSFNVVDQLRITRQAIELADKLIADREQA